MRFYNVNLFKVIGLYFYMIGKYRSFKVQLYVSTFEENGYQPYFSVLKNKYFHMVPISGIKLYKK